MTCFQPHLSGDNHRGTALTHQACCFQPHLSGDNQEGCPVAEMDSQFPTPLERGQLHLPMVRYLLLHFQPLLSGDNFETTEISDRYPLFPTPLERGQPPLSSIITSANCFQPHLSGDNLVAGLTSAIRYHFQPHLSGDNQQASLNFSPRSLFPTPLERGQPFLLNPVRMSSITFLRSRCSPRLQAEPVYLRRATYLNPQTLV